MQKTDIAILGGGIAGLWLLNLLAKRGYSVLLVEKEALGSGQTIASQGMIHGGIKYALGGFLSDASETIAAMPARWQACLAGQGTLDLSAVRTLAQDYFLFSDAKLSSRVTAFLGSKAIESRVTRVGESDRPEVLRNDEFKGRVYKLQDFVLDTRSLVEELARPFQNRIHTGSFNLRVEAGKIAAIELDDNSSISARQYILAAGQGNGELIKQLNLPVTMQLRPLKQVIVTGPDLPRLYAHAVSLKAGGKPRLTITTHYLDDGAPCWYLGGQLAETGVEQSDQALIAQARSELQSLLSWVDFSNCSYRTLSINRAEPSQKHQKRPDEPYAEQFGNTLVCWPTKMTLAPLLGDKVDELLQFTPEQTADIHLSRPVSLATSPWSIDS